jgi:uncharacterized protein (DUF433 family)
MSQTIEHSAPGPSGGGWGLRYPGLVLDTGGPNTVVEFTGIWPLKANADLDALTASLAPGGWTPPDLQFSTATTMLGLIRTARWFVAWMPGGGHALIFVSQFDGGLEKYLDDFVLNGKENLSKVWGQCVGCPAGPDVTAADIVEYIARGQIKTLACYDVFPSLSLAQIYKAADWYEKTQRFQRAVAKGDGNLEDQVNAFFADLAKPYTEVLSDAVIDAGAGQQWQYEDVAENLTR